MNEQLPKIQVVIKSTTGEIVYIGVDRVKAKFHFLALEYKNIKCEWLETDANTVVELPSEGVK